MFFWRMTPMNLFIFETINRCLTWLLSKNKNKKPMLAQNLITIRCLGLLYLIFLLFF